MSYRFLPYDFQIKTMTDKRYGANKLGPDYLLQDWALTYDELEPYFDKFEKRPVFPVMIKIHLAENVQILIRRGQ